MRLNDIFESHLTSEQLLKNKTPIKTVFPAVSPIISALHTKLLERVWSCFRGLGNSFQPALTFIRLLFCRVSCFLSIQKEISNQN